MTYMSPTKPSTTSSVRTGSTEALLCTLVIDVHEDRYVDTVDVKGADLHAEIDDNIMSHYTRKLIGLESGFMMGKTLTDYNHFYCYFKANNLITLYKFSLY